MVMDNLLVHKSRSVKELVEEKGCELWFLPAYLPDLINPIEEAFSKVKGILRKAKARTLGALFELPTGRALCAVGKEDAHGFFGHCGYAMTQDHSHENRSRLLVRSLFVDGRGTKKSPAVLLPRLAVGL